MLPRPGASLRAPGTRPGFADGLPTALPVSGGEGVPDFTLQDFTLKAAGQLFEHVDVVGQVGRTNPIRQKLHQRLRQLHAFRPPASALAQRDGRDDPLRARRLHNADFLDEGVLARGLFDRARENRPSAALQHVLLTIENVETPLGVDVSDVLRMPPAASQRPRRAFRIAPVAGRDCRREDGDLSRLTRWQDRAALRLDPPTDSFEGT